MYVGVYYLCAATEAERQKWVTALTLSKAKAIRNLESGMIYIHVYINDWQSEGPGFDPQLGPGLPMTQLMKCPYFTVTCMQCVGGLAS